MYLHKNKKFLSLIIICFSFFYSTKLFSQLEFKHESSSLAIEQAINQNLAQDLTWLRLIHFRVTPKIAQQSDVLSPEFFLAYDKNSHNEQLGLITPEQELIASLEAFFAEIPRNQNAHAQCRFPARYFWLSQELDLSSAPKPHCERLQNWAKFDSLESVSLLMVSGYFGNPASTFGHLLVKLNNSEFRASSGNLLDQSINYGAEVPDSEPIPIYIAKGLTGGYVSRFADKKYYTQDLVYSKNELRDIWEYELNLSSEENQLLVFHIWEMLGVKSTYYFLKENCGYRIAELLELVTSQTMTPSYQPWYLPVSVFQGLEDIEQGKYIKTIKFIPSTQRKLHDAFANFNAPQTTSLNQMFADPTLITSNNSPLAAYAPHGQAKLVDFMLEYYQYKADQNSEDEHLSKTYKLYKSKLLAKRFKLPIIESAEVNFTQAIISPAKGAKPRLISIGMSKAAANETNVNLGIGLLHSDVLSNSKGTLENSELTAFYANIDIDSTNDITLRRLDILRILKLGLSDTTLFGETNKTWRVGLGFEKSNVSCFDCTNFYIGGGLGKTFVANNKLISYAMLNTKYVQENKQVELSPELGLIFTANDSFKTYLQTGLKVNTKTGQKDEFINMETRFLLNTNNSFRFSYEKLLGEEFRLTFNRTF